MKTRRNKIKKAGRSKHKTPTHKLPQGWPCPYVGCTGRMFEFIVPYLKTTLNGQEIFVNNARYAQCNKCKGKAYSVTEIRRWKMLIFSCG
jgi:hypothetical protein